MFIRKAYDPLKLLEFEFIIHDPKKKEILESIEEQLNTIDGHLEEIDENILRSIISGERSVASLTVLKIGHIEEKLQLTSQSAKTLKYYVTRYKRKVRELCTFDRAVRDLVLFNIMIKRCLDKIPKLLEAVKAISAFWISLEKNIKNLSKFISDKQSNEHAIDQALNYLEEADEDFNFFIESVSYFSSNTSINVSYDTDKNNFLDLVFILKDTKL